MEPSNQADPCHKTRTHKHTHGAGRDHNRVAVCHVLESVSKLDFSPVFGPAGTQQKSLISTLVEVSELGGRPQSKSTVEEQEVGTHLPFDAYSGERWLNIHVYQGGVQVSVVGVQSPA